MTDLLYTPLPNQPEDDLPNCPSCEYYEQDLIEHPELGKPYYYCKSCHRNYKIQIYTGVKQ